MTMKVGTAEIDITPAPGGELCGFALREQPSIGVLDPLRARALYLVDGLNRLLWLHCDLIGLDAAIVADFRDWALRELGLAACQVMLSATHTHSGPGTIRLTGAGAYDETYVAGLHARLQQASRLALRATEPCTIETGEGRLDLAQHRRDPRSAHTDPRVGAVGFRRDDGTYAAVIANYAIHPVALGHENRRLSADLFGAAADALSARLPGRPVVLMTNGACGNLNPPSTRATPEETMAWGRRLADAVVLSRPVRPDRPGAGLAVASLRCPLPLDVLDRAGLVDYGRRILDAAAGAQPGWRDKLRAAVTVWAQVLDAAIETGRVAERRQLELFAVAIGDTVFLGADAELFSIFTDWVRRDTGLNVYTVGYANGDRGYVCPRDAYAEGGYEVETAHLFYGGYRFQAGALERLADAAGGLLRREFPDRLPVATAEAGG